MYDWISYVLLMHYVFLLTGLFLFQYLELYLTRVDGLRRRILLSDEVEGILDFSLIRDTFQVRCTAYHSITFLLLNIKN